MRFDGLYRSVLSIPVNTCERFSVHPLAWLRYLGFTIYGTEGYISASPGGTEIEYYQDIQAGIYYYVSEGDLYFRIQGPPVHFQYQSGFCSTLI